MFSDWKIVAFLKCFTCFNSSESGLNPTFTGAVSKLTACRCSSSYRATTWAGNKQGGEGWKRRSQIHSELEKGGIIEEETAEEETSEACYWDDIHREE